MSALSFRDSLGVEFILLLPFFLIYFFSPVKMAKFLREGNENECARSDSPHFVAAHSVGNIFAALHDIVTREEWASVLRRFDIWWYFKLFANAVSFLVFFHFLYNHGANSASRVGCLRAALYTTYESSAIKTCIVGELCFRMAVHARRTTPTEALAAKCNNCRTASAKFPEMRSH